MENLIAALETWKEDQVGRLPPIKLICPQCGKGFSTEFRLPESCPSCQALLLQPRRAASRVFAIIAIAVLVVTIPAAIYFFLGALSNDPGMGKLARLLVENKTVFFFVSLAIILPMAGGTFIATMQLFGDLFGHAARTESEKDRLSTFSGRLTRAKAATSEMKYWTFCRLVLTKGPPYRVVSSPYGKAPTSLIELARDLEIAGILLYLLSGGQLGNPAAMTSRGPYAGWIRSIMHDSPALTEAAGAMRAAANEDERKWLAWFAETFAFGSFNVESPHQYKGAPEFAKEFKSMVPPPRTPAG